MNNLMFLSSASVTILLVYLVFTCIMASLCLIYNMMILKKKPSSVIGDIVNAAVLIRLFYLTYILASYIYNTYQGFFVSEIHSPVVMITETTIYLAYVTVSLLRAAAKDSEQMSSFSVKQALDTLDFGLLYYYTGGRHKGERILCNEKMEDLMFLMTGKYYSNGNMFRNDISEKELKKGCRKKVIQSDVFYELPDKTLWQFESNKVKTDNEDVTLLMASDVTEILKRANSLYEQNKELEQKNAELKKMLDNLTEACRTKEILRAKTRVHDVLGQNISMILRSVREHKAPDRKLLMSFENGFPDEIKNDNDSTEYSLYSLASDFKDLGVKIAIEGTMPSDRSIRKVFHKTASEAFTNAVRHGYATEISVKVSKKYEMWELLITDNGITSEEIPAEGGGLKSMRKMAESLEGTFSYALLPHFNIKITIPEVKK